MNAIGIPYKKFMQLTDLLIEYRNQPTQATETALIAEQERLGWPWSMNAKQTREWNETCRRLDA